MRAPVLHEARSAAAGVQPPRVRRLKFYGPQPKRLTVHDAGDAVRFVAKRLEGESQEVFIEFVMNVRGLVLAIYELARGQKSHVTIGADDAIYAALGGGYSSKRGEAFYVLHNHPSGNPTPSPADLRLTRRLARAAAPFDPELLFLGQAIVAGRSYWDSRTNRIRKVP